MLRSVDGGSNWQAVGPSDLSDLDFRDIHALDEERAWIVSAGLPAVIAFTRNGGRSWEIQYRSEVEGVFFDAIDFWDESSGIVFSDPVDGKFLLLVTDDGGARWREVERDALPEPVEGEAGFAGSGTCLRVFGSRHAWVGTGGGASRVLRTEDRGATWSIAPSALRSSPSAGVFSIVFLDEQRGVAVGGDYKDETGTDRVVSRSEDGGRTWQLVESDGTGGFRSAVGRLGNADDALIAVGSGGADVSRDGGRTWRPFGESGFHAVSSAGEACWAVGANGRIAKLALATPGEAREHP